MRFEGSIKSWNDDRGFGFVVADQGGDEVFVHIKAIRGLRGRPQAGLRLSFEVQPGPQGKKRAVNAEVLSAPRTATATATATATRRSAAARPAARSGAGGWGPLALLGLVLLGGFALGRPPHWVLLLYPGLSVLTYLAYAMDKAAAQRGAWRISEAQLLTLGLFGGWPGALLAQRSLRHKSAKASFQAAFWGSVVLNLVGFVALASPWGEALWPR